MRKLFQLLGGLALLILVAGCSGINAGTSVSPLSFFLPGLLKADPPPRLGPPPAGEFLPSPVIFPPLPEPAPVQQIALVR